MLAVIYRTSTTDFDEKNSVEPTWIVGGAEVGVRMSSLVSLNQRKIKALERIQRRIQRRHFSHCYSCLINFVIIVEI